MQLVKIAIVVGLASMLAGCSTLEEAWRVQESTEPIGKGIVNAANVQKINLHGYSLAQLVEYAFTNRPSVVTARLAVEKARYDLKIVKADAPLLSDTPWSAPKLNLGGSYDAASERYVSRLAWDTHGQAAAYLSLDLLVWDFGRNSAQARAASEEVIASEISLIQEGYTVFEDVATAYFTLLEADALLSVARTNEFEYAEHLRQAKLRLEAGEAQKLDVTRAQLDLAEAREQTVAASNLVVTCGADLMWALGIGADRGSREDVMLPASDSLEKVMRGFADTCDTVDSVFDAARTNAPAMAVARARLRAASADVDYAIANLLPKITASSALFWADPQWYWSWAVSAVQSIFSGFSDVYAIDRAVVQLKSAASAVDEEEQKLSRSIELAIAERDNAREALATAHASVKASRENYETVKAQYREGDASRIDFTDAIGSYATAIGSSVTAYYRGQIAEAKLFSTVGRMPEYDEKKIAMEER